MRSRFISTWCIVLGPDKYQLVVRKKTELNTRNLHVQILLTAEGTVYLIKKQPTSTVI